MPIVNPGASPAVPNVQTVASVSVFSDVRALGAGQYPLIEVLGGTTIGDGLDGVFYWNSTSLVADDAANTLAPNAGGTGRWIRLYGSLSLSTGSSHVGTIQSGTGALARTANAKMGEIVALADYGTSGQYDTARTGTSLDLTIAGILNVNSTLLVGVCGTITSGVSFEMRSGTANVGALVYNTTQADSNSAPLFLAGRNAAGTNSNVSIEAVTKTGANVDLVVRAGGTGATGFGTRYMTLFGAATGQSGRGRLAIGSQTTARAHLDVLQPSFTASATETPIAFKVSAGTLDGLDASVEVNDIDLKFPGSVTLAAGALATMRTININTPRSYAFVSASTITTAATLAIAGPPTQGANCTITTALTLWIQSGATQLDGNLFVNGAGGIDAVASGLVSLRMTHVTTNSTLKQGRITTRHYTNAQPDIGTIIVLGDSAANDVLIGGGSSAVNAATTVTTYAAANNTTTTGTAITKVTIDGLGVLITPISTTNLTLPAGTTAKSSLSIPHGAAPTSPVNGDVWTTTAGIFVRINGGTVGPLT